MQYYYYSRTSTVGQNSSRQLENFKAHGHVKAANVFIDKIQGNVPFFQRPAALKLYDSLTSSEGANRTVVIDSIDRLGRNLIDILNTIEVFNNNQINLKSLKEGFETLIDGKENPMSRIVVSVMGSLAQLERERIRSRQQEGILIAKAQGKFKGRKVGSVQTPEKLLARYPVVVQKLKKGLSVRDVSELTTKSTTTVMKVKKALENAN